MIHRLYNTFIFLIVLPSISKGLEVIEATNLKYFTKEMTAEFYALKGMFLAQIGRSSDANKAFSAAVQMHDTLIKAWALWGDYLEQTFTKDRCVFVIIIENSNSTRN